VTTKETKSLPKSRVGVKNRGGVRCVKGVGASRKSLGLSIRKGTPQTEKKKKKGEKKFEMGNFP